MIHPQIAEVLRGLQEPPQGPIDPALLRAADEAQVPPVEERLPLQAVQDSMVGDVPVRIYTPALADEYAVIVYIRGGAFFLGSLETHDHVARSLAKATGCKVIAVDYRRAPEHVFPAGLQDCYSVVRWVVEHGSDVAWNGRDLALVGDSSGANFAAVVAGMAHDDGLDAITAQVLYYPSLDLDFDTERYASLQENARGYGLETAALKPFNAFYLDSGADPADPRVSPIKRTDLSGLPRTLIITAEHDPLRDEGELYGERLREAGVDVTVSRYDGANHGFVQHFSWIPEFARVFEQTAAFLAGGDR